jgi:hypothetical protein
MAVSLPLLALSPCFAEDESRGVDTQQGTSPLPAPRENAPNNTGASTNGAVSPQTCTGSCNRAYDGCMDQQSAVPGNGDTLRYSNNYADKLIGTSSDCSDHLRTCLNGCGG